MNALPPLAAPASFTGGRVTGEPARLRHELAWPVELADGRRAVLAQLAPELAREPALRRRYVTDMERLVGIVSPSLAATLEVGPAPDPRDPAAEPPWRVRLEPEGALLEATLARAPLPIDEAIELVAVLADTLQGLHAAGLVVRDLDPRSVVVSADARRAWLTDVGHARLTILSSRTASSLLVESSPYVAPEALVATVVDARADVYSLGVVLWRALTGRVPFEASLVGARTALPPLGQVRPEAPRGLAEVVLACLAAAPEARPPTARDVAAALRGRGSAASTALVVARVQCQACGAPMRTGLRLCLACGRQAVQFHRAAPGDLDATSIVLQRAREDAAFVANLRGFFESVATYVPKLNFVIGDRRMYDKRELAQRHALPAVLVADLEPATSTALVQRLAAGGLRVTTVSRRQLRRRRRIAVGVMAASAVLAVLGTIAMFASGAAVGFGVAMVVLAVGAAMVSFGRRRMAIAAERRLPIAELRPTPAALPASDELVALVAGALAASKSPDVRARLEDVALLVQRLADAREETSAEGAIAADAATGPVRPLAELARTTAAAIEAIDAQLGSLDEGAIVRALARCEARGEAAEVRQDLLAGLDTLRALEEQRARLFGRLLEITSLVRTAVERGLREAAATRSDDIEVAHALAGLSA